MPLSKQNKMFITVHVTMMFLGVMLVTKSSSCVLISWTLLQIVILSCLQEPEIKQNFTYYWCMNSLRHIVDIYEIIDKWNVYKS